MPVNPGHEYQKAEIEYQQADTLEERLTASRKMLQVVPKHKSSENLVALIRKRISKLLKLQDRKKEIARRRGKSEGLKKEGAARVCIIGSPNSGKSTLLAKLTNAKPTIADYPFTTKKAEVGTLDYRGVKIQVVEIPPIVENFIETEKGQFFASIIKEASLLIVTFRNPDEKRLALKELKKMNIKIPHIEYNFQEDTTEQVKYYLWQNLGIIKVYTKQPHKEKDFPPVALAKGSTIKDLARKIHKDFVKDFKFAKIFGKSARFKGQQVGVNHVLADDDVVELHIGD